ncbi:hypothetical protein PCE1_002548 [Barthelona sp. PCE]
MNIVDSQQYRAFMQSYPLLSFSSASKTLYYHQVHPKNSKTNSEALIFIPGAASKASSFYALAQSLVGLSYNSYLLEIPSVEDHTSFVALVSEFINRQRLRKVHLVGASLGAFLGFYLASQRPYKIASIFSINGFLDTHHYYNNRPFMGFYGMLPASVLRNFFLECLPDETQLKPEVYKEVLGGIDFLAESIRELERKDLICRLKLATQDNVVSTVPEVPIAGVYSCAFQSVPMFLQRELVKRFSDNYITPLQYPFPYLSSPNDVLLYLIPHLRRADYDPNRDLRLSGSTESEE